MYKIVVILVFSVLLGAGQIEASPAHTQKKYSNEKTNVQASFSFEDNFDNLPLGRISSDKWDSAVDSEESFVKVVNEDGRGKVIHVMSPSGKAFLTPKISVTDLPYTIEFDLKVPAAKAKGGNKTLFGSLILFYQVDGEKNGQKPDWQINLQDYCYTLSIPKLGKTHYKPTQSTGKGWGHVRIDVDSGNLIFAAVAEGRKMDYKEEFQILPNDNKTGRLYFNARPSWGYQTVEFWLDNVRIKLKPVAERNAYKQKYAIYQELEATFKTQNYRMIVGNEIPSELTEAAKLLKDIATYSETEVEKYKAGLDKLDRLFEQCAIFYRKHEAAIFAASFPTSNNYIPLELSSFYNHTPRKRHPIFRQFTPLVRVESVPFWVSPVAPYTRQFSLEGKESLEIPVGQTAQEIFLLLQPQWELDYQGNGVYPDTSFTNNDGPITRRDLTGSGSSEAIHVAFQVEICYKDGDKERAVPLLLSSNTPIMKRDKISVYAIRPSQNKTIASIVLHDQMNDWAALLYGVTLGTVRSADRSVQVVQKSMPVKNLAKAPASVEITADKVILESPAYRICMAKSGVLRFTELFNKYSDRNFLLGNSGSLLLTGPFAPASQYSKLAEDQQGRLKPENVTAPHFDFWQIQRITKNSKDEVLFHIENSAKNLSGKLLVKAEFEEIRIEATLKNNGQKQENLAVIFPLMKRINAGEYFLPLRSGVISDRPLDFDGDYASNFYVMMQMLAAWDTNKQAGISLRVEDSSGEMKSFRLYKSAAKGSPEKFRNITPENVEFHPDHIGPLGAGMMFGVQYYYVSLRSGQSKSLPPAVIGVHPGTWKVPLQRYAEWVKTWFKQIRPVPERVRRVALSVSGGGLDEQSTPKSGLEWGGVDVVHLMDIHSVDYPDAIKKYIPGLRNSRINYARRKPPIGRGVYATEGSYLRTETKLFGDIGHKWSLKDFKGNVSYFQPLTKDQVRICRSNPQWHQALAEACAMVAETDPTWVYVDTIGVTPPCLCFDKEHKHGISPAEELKGTVKEMETITKAVMRANPNVGVMTEGPGCDYQMQFRDGSWTSMRSWETINNPGNFLYFRYIRPTFKLIELGGDSVTRSKICYFNGVPVNIYIYRGEDRTTKTLSPLVKGYRKFWDVFTGEEMEADVPTGVQDVYMNRFGSRKQKRMVYAVANWGHATWRGKLNLEYFPGAHYTEVTNNDKELKFTVDDNQNRARLELSIDPYEVVYIGVTPK